MSDTTFEQIKNLETEIRKVKNEQIKLSNRLKILQNQKDDLQNKYDLEKVRNRPNTDEWFIKKFEWSDRLEKTLEEKFGFKEFRPKQLAAINATLDKKDVLLLMPTGGGKSLAYQLPSLMEKGLTLVVSPLLSLIEDQLIGLRKLNIKSASINGATSKNDKKQVHTQMTDPKGGLKLLYVTPEWLAKSKQFMSYLQKCFNAGNLNRVAIDEVHCCSTWGHDFRPEYNFLGLLKPMFPGVPFMGLTATATMNVLIDTQKMLGMEDCTIITAPFNRPNLYYKVVSKPSQKEDSINFLTKLLKNKYLDQSGIIYTTTVKETEELTQKLRNNGLKVMNYHAQLTDESKKKIHEKWLNGSYQAVIATIAFGMGIDKPNVRFVIHYSMPKSMEGLYQESGRAGRDGQKSDCILMFALADYLKMVGMAHSKTEEKNANSVLEYCLEPSKCRRSIIATHFEEVWKKSDCNKMCDHCKKNQDIVSYDITKAYHDLVAILNLAETKEIKLTLLKLTNSWLQTGPKEVSISSLKAPKISKEHAELIISYLIIKNYLKIEKGFTLYSCICYIKKNSSIIPSAKLEMTVSSEINLNGFTKNTLNDSPEPKKPKLC